MKQQSSADTRFIAFLEKHTTHILFFLLPLQLTSKNATDKLCQEVLTYQYTFSIILVIIIVVINSYLL